MNLTWTNHSKRKMKYYRLSESRVKRVLNNPKRKEIGIAPGTVAVMQPASTRGARPLRWRGESTRGGPAKEEWKSEIWVMYQTNAKCKMQNAKIKIISAWRYPGKSPIRGPVPIPEEILQELAP